ncbi:MAG: hypothetical protein EXS31_06160 [Pedosphaera sp.]|nr:hypothetical protein [Pedosphaera sp.]
MRFDKRNFCRTLILLAGVAMAMFIVLRVGIGATDYQTTDSAGRAMGFNDRLSAEHYWIMARNFSPTDLFRWEWAYEWLLIAMYACGCWLIFSGSKFGRRSTRQFFAAQAVIFPFAWLGLIWLPNILRDISAGRMDREGFIDIPVLWVTAHTVWLITSLTITFVMPGESLAFNATVRRFLDALWQLLSGRATRHK